MTAETILLIAVGALLILLGLLTWKKQKIAILHEYHYKNVKESDIPAYTRVMGIGQIVIGAGACLTWIIQYFTGSPLSWIAFAAGLAVGLILFHNGQMKYNGSWFS